MNKDTLKNITSKRLFLPVVCLLAVLLANVIKTPDFFKITLENGVLSGYIIITDNRMRCKASQSRQNFKTIITITTRLKPCPDLPHITYLA